jgi:hypothetical protein
VLVPKGFEAKTHYQVRRTHPPVKLFEFFGGKAGIRTLDTAFQPYNGLANRRLQPLGHLSVKAITTWKNVINPNF